ncbi:disease resistance protein RPS2 [Spatholobus suberectus]|nr:disease resistance protein RPS2 [Spatholobus suberectus]
MSLSMSKSLMNLQSLFVSECGMMESIFNQTEESMIETEESIFPKLKNINLRSMKRLREIWTKFPPHSFGKLDALIIDGCNKLENIFPSYMVGRFRSLCNLKVTNCKSMKEIFDLNGCKRDAEDTRLQNVHVEALPKLEHVWNKDPEGILNFKNLEKIWVRECLNLKHIFPVSIATCLKKLKYLEVWNCGQVKEIVFRGETINKNSVLFEFPKLTTARFLRLPNLESFYRGTHELCCSTLNNISVEHCHKLKLFRTEIANSEIKPVFLPEKVIYNLKSMQIEPRDSISLKRYMGNYRMHNCLMTPSTAKSLVQLTTIKVIQCESMKTIVSEQEIELDALHELESFCSSHRCAIEFPSLEKVVVSACGKMERFTFSELVNKTPNLRQLCVRHGKEEKRLYWEGDLNATIRHVYKIRVRIYYR